LTAQEKLNLVFLRTFDPLGLNPIKARMREIPEKRCVFVVRGPYRWVHQPLYFCILELFWAPPEVTADRILFNVLWTTWIWLASRHEKDDLMVDFGDSYRDYRRKVPMLIPWRGPVAL
jgi:protein-S-isoprenylcysteine O-methyltransferase Ste14